MRAVLIIGAVFVAFVGIIVVSLIGANNSAVSSEAGIKAQYDSMAVKLSEFSTGVIESLQITGFAKDDLKELIEASVQGRYGEDGAKNMFLNITEAYPGQLDPALYTNLQAQIQAGRANFADEQKKLVSRVQTYRTSLDSVPGGLFMRLVGFPRIDFADYAIITDERTQDIFSTKTDRVLKMER